MGLLYFLMSAVVMIGVLIVIGAVVCLVLFALRPILHSFGHSMDSVIGGRLFSGVILIGIIAATCGVIALGTYLPDRADLRLWLAELTGYPATHVVFELADTDRDTRQAVIDTFTPMMQQYRTRYAYRVTNFRSHSSHVERSAMPSRYRSDGHRLEIMTGEAIDTEANPMLIPILHALASQNAALPRELPAAVDAGGRHDFDIAVLPATAELSSRRVHSPQFGIDDRQCTLDVEGLVSTDVANRAYARPRLRPGESRHLVIGDDSPLRKRRYRIVRLSYVRGDGGRLHKPDPNNGLRIFMALSLAPIGMQNTGEHCARSLLEALDPAWLIASVRHTFPEAARAITGVQTRLVEQFSPWRAGEGWHDMTSEENS